MIFVNISGRGLYMQCCHREVEPGGSFTVSWDSVKRNRAVRAAMSSGALSWTSSHGEPEVPGSPVPEVRVSSARPAAASAAGGGQGSGGGKASDAKASDFGRHMRNLGKFKAKTVTPRVSRSEKASSEAPLTRDDIIDDVPLSLDAIRRHNAAVKLFGTKAGGGR